MNLGMIHMMGFAMIVCMHLQASLQDEVVPCQLFVPCLDARRATQLMHSHGALLPCNVHTGPAGHGHHCGNA